MTRHRSYSIEFKRQVAQEFLAGETLHGLAKRLDISRNLIRLWVERYQAGVFDEDAAAADLLEQYEARIAALERLVGKQALELEFLKGALKTDPDREARARRRCRPPGLSIAEGCRLMGISRSTYYDPSIAARDDTAIVEAIAAICDEFECYGWRRVRAELRHRGWSSITRNPAIDARARPSAAPATPVCRNNEQRSRSADLSQSSQRLDRRRTEPTLGRRHHLCRHRRRLRLCRGDPRRFGRAALLATQSVAPSTSA